ncbi:hypothetical protein, partial [Abiotrophia defectiva]|uniref:hypothetical protein n=1 Tax=Abiotrophia defectiva TaxID=46125 RepID=UPI0026E92047
KKTEKPRLKWQGFLCAAVFRKAETAGASGPLFKVDHWLAVFRGFCLISAFFWLASFRGFCRISAFFRVASGPLSRVDH